MDRFLSSALILCFSTLAAAQPFGEPVQWPFGLQAEGTGALVFANGFDWADIDHDGDEDLFIFFQDSSQVLFYENIGNPEQPQFAKPQTNPFQLEIPEPGFLTYHSFSLVDIDADGDEDLLLGDLMRPFLFLENTGTPHTPQFAPAASNSWYLEDGSLRPHAFGDIDNDGDLDVLTTVYLGGTSSKICLVENKGSASQPDFLLPGDLDYLGDGELGLGNGVFADFDADGDADYLHSEVDGNITFHENLGERGAISFSQEIINPWGFAKSAPNNSSLQLVDIDQDNDLDYFELDLFTGVLYFRENQMEKEGLVQVVHFFEALPTPGNTGFTIRAELTANCPEIQLFLRDANGEIMESFQVEALNNHLETEINTQDLPLGTYSLDLETSFGNFQYTLPNAD
jgi:hypothetical protein